VGFGGGESERVGRLWGFGLMVDFLVHCLAVRFSLGMLF
jgi:hypothetical protein